MNRQDDNPLDDADLAPYLEGRDGISDAYKASSTETPPAALDAAILQAARASLQRPVRAARTAGLRNYYSLAASLTLGIMLGAVMFRDGSEAVVVSSSALREAPVPTSAAPAVSVSTSDGAGASESGDAIPTEAVPPAPAPGQPEVFRAADAVAAPQAEAPAVNNFTERTLPAPQAPIATIEAQAPQAAPDTGATGTRQAQAARTNTAQLEEIQVTGSRIRADYRDDQQRWLEEIVRLATELEQATGRTDELRSALEFERDEFRLAFPGVDLDQAEQNLRRQ